MAAPPADASAATATAPSSPYPPTPSAPAHAYPQPVAGGAYPYAPPAGQGTPVAPAVHPPPSPYPQPTQPQTPQTPQAPQASVPVPAPQPRPRPAPAAPGRAVAGGQVPPEPQDLLPTVLASLALRDLTLVESLLGLVEEMEEHEEDPRQLELLYRIDHLATRMRRNGENMLVLAGQDSASPQFEPEPLLNVVRAGISEITDYGRVRVGALPNVTVAGIAVDDVSHLLAELLDNATSKSPEREPVTVSGRSTADGAVVLAVEDNGIGVAADRLADINARLAGPPVLDLTATRHMGLYVVSRLARRHGLRVQIQPRLEGGTAAQVLLPARLVQPAAPPPSVHAVAGDGAQPVTAAANGAGPAAPNGLPARPVGPTTAGGLPRRVPASTRPARRDADAAPTPPADAAAGRDAGRAAPFAPATPAAAGTEAGTDAGGQTDGRDTNGPADADGAAVGIGPSHGDTAPTRQEPSHGDTASTRQEPSHGDTAPTRHEPGHAARTIHDALAGFETGQFEAMREVAGRHETEPE